MSQIEKKVMATEVFGGLSRRPSHCLVCAASSRGVEDVDTKNGDDAVTQDEFH